MIKPNVKGNLKAEYLSALKNVIKSYYEWLCVRAKWAWNSKKLFSGDAETYEDYIIDEWQRWCLWKCEIMPRQLSKEIFDFLKENLFKGLDTKVWWYSLFVKRIWEIMVIPKEFYLACVDCLRKPVPEDCPYKRLITVLKVIEAAKGLWGPFEKGRREPTIWDFIPIGNYDYKHHIMQDKISRELDGRWAVPRIEV